MSATATLEAPAIQDTLFGEPRPAQVVAGPEPDSPCFCICGCLTKDVKVSNSNLDWAALAMGPDMPQP